MKTACAIFFLCPLLVRGADPLHWYEVDTIRTPSAIVFGNDHWLGIFDDGRYSSTNALGWSKRSGNTSATRPEFLRGEFYYIGTSLSVSSNGWSNFRMLGEPLGLSEVQVFTFGNDQFYAARNNEIVFSTDAKAWTRISLPEMDARIKLMAAGHGMVILVTRSGYSYSSNDGLTWNPFYLGFSLADLKATDSGFLGLEYFRTPSGAFGTRIHHTYDGQEWRVVQEKPGLADRLFVAPQTVVVWGLDLLALVTHDGAEWNDVSRPSKKLIRDVAYGQGRFVGVLWPSGFISSSPFNIPHITSFSKTGTTIRIQAQSAQNSIVETTDRLGTPWSVMSNVTQNAAIIEFQEPPSANAFFRLKAAP